MKKKVKVITDPEVIKLMLEDTRRQILKLLRNREMTISQLSDILGKTPQTVYHHIEKLKEVGLVEVKRTEMKGNLVEKYYGRTADVFYINLYLGDEELRYLARSKLKTKLDIFKALGYKFNEEQLLDIMDKITEKEHSYTTKISKELEGKEEALKEFSNEDIIHAVDWLSMAELGRDEEALELLRKLGEILKKE
ncbi:MAG TPA: ArsR family transcriptional regulator [Thermococcaceae archaeon]|uniref:Transcriptional regulatory protein, arsR family n=1 Tax=Thermococcus sibiricus TaxID=172049 RepID=A0A117L135_9EURY|nr:winged helix-turn-helix domain-containing protein [Thermococcus sibiricus]KUK17016.1 MAG: Transcriptional regulatory protein, arsR family [Thermococcus sibiricus]KUK28740.1 MAG: Transcriptional regulatory protein, arsR family [Thermococcus sp. 40_45]HII67808.1 ArsR family transcriptional regulator [Thermococcaceae archaeon]